MQEEALIKFTDHFGVPWTWEEISPINTVKNINADLLLIHDENDTEVPHDQAIPLQKSAPLAKIITTTGLGHRKILMNKNVVAASINFIRESP